MRSLLAITHCNTPQYAATSCNTLQHIITHCSALQHTATHCNLLQLTAILCNILQHTATHCNMLQHTAILYFDMRSLAHAANRAHLMGSRALSGSLYYCRSISGSCLAYLRKKTIEYRGARADAWVGRKEDWLLLVLSYVVNKSLSPVLSAAYHP